VERLASPPNRTRGRVLVCDANADMRQYLSRVLGLESGADEYLVKPFSSRQLLRRVKNLILVKQTRDALQLALATQEGDLSHLTEELMSSRHALARSEAYLEEAQRLTGTGAWAWNPGTGVLFWSPEHFRILGLDAHGPPPTYPELLHYIHPEDRQVLQQAFENAVKEAKDYECTFRVVRPDGTIRHINSLAHPRLDPSGAISEYVGTIIDVTESSPR
jgi:PAS domain S-box-containing protein